MVRESQQYIKERGGPAPHIRTSAHFALHWGNENKTNVKIDDAYLDKAMEWLEYLWDLYINKFQFPAGKHGYKINAYITGTGLKPFLDGYAFGFPDPDGYGVLIGHPSIFTFGHNGAAHEFAHALQGETKGFRDSQYVGWFWECHAQYLAHQATGKSDLPHVLDRYAQTSHFDVASTRHHYGCWIFFQYIAARYPNGMDMVNHLWIEPALSRDEDPIAKLRRTLPFTGDRDVAWADLIGDYARHNVAWNFYRLGQEYRTSLRFFDQMDRRNYFTYLEPSPVRSEWYRVPRIYAPQQNGYNIIPLTVSPGAKRVTVDLEGFVEPAHRSAWRATLVSLDKNFNERFSPTWASGTGSIEVKPDEKLFLVVAATPLKHLPPRFVERYPDIPVFPYEVRFSGASPNALNVRLRRIPTVPGHRHPNGGGFVADTAQVASTAFVGTNAAVLDRAHVEKSARIEGFATISGDALVTDRAIVGGNALVTNRATVQDEALITDYAELYDGCKIGGRARVLAAGRVFGSNEVMGEAVVKGFASIRGVKSMSGGAIADGEVEWDFGSPQLTTDICFGTLLQKEPGHQAESNHLYARYSAGTELAWRLRDDFGSNDGILHKSNGVSHKTEGKTEEKIERKIQEGQSNFVQDTERGHALQLTSKLGSGDFVDLPRDVALSRQITISAWVKLESTGRNQCLIGLGRDENELLELLATNAEGATGLRIRHGGERIDLNGPTIPVNRWCHLVVTLADSGTKLYVDGKLAASVPKAVSTNSLQPTRVFLGRGLTGGYLNGRVADVAFYTTALSAGDIQGLK